MSNGKDHPGEYRVLPSPNTAEGIKALAEAQENDKFLLVAMTSAWCVFYRKDKH